MAPFLGTKTQLLDPAKVAPHPNGRIVLKYGREEDGFIKSSIEVKIGENARKRGERWKLEKEH